MHPACPQLWLELGVSPSLILQGRPTQMSSSYLLEAASPLQLLAQSCCQSTGCLDSLPSRRLLRLHCLLQRCQLLCQGCSLHRQRLLRIRDAKGSIRVSPSMGGSAAQRVKQGVGMQRGVLMLLTCPSAATCRSLSAMSAFTCCTAANTLLVSAATSTTPAASSSRARWISSYLHGQDTTVTQGPPDP